MTRVYQRHRSVVLPVICYLAGISTGMLLNVMQSSTTVMIATQERDDSPAQHSAWVNNFKIYCDDPHKSNPGKQRSHQRSNTTASVPTEQEETMYMYSSADVQKMMKFKRTAEYKNASDEMRDAIAIENEEIRKIRAIRALTDDHVYSEVVTEIIPAHMLPRYAEEFLLFPTTRSMLRQSRTITGNSNRLQMYIRKLHSQQCTTVLFLGGSVTKGHKAGGFINSYPKFFCDWLNARYPCIVNGTIGTHRSKLTSSATHSSQEIVMNWPVVSGIESFDLVFLEFNINDAFISTNPHMLEDKGPISKTTEYTSGWYFEILLRRLLLLRKPDPVAIVTFNADYVGNEWADKSVAEWAKADTQINARKTLFRKNPEPVKAWISSLYEIPVFSASVWMLALHSKKGMKRQFMRDNPFSTDAWHWGADCCHPHREGHLILSLVLAYCFVDEEKYMMHFANEKSIYIEHDSTAFNEPTPKLRDPLYLSAEEDSIYVHNTIDMTQLDFTHPEGEEKWKNSILLKAGWSFYADNVEGNKYGLISNDASGETHLAIAIIGGKLGLIELSYIMSYENFGDALAWISNPDSNVIDLHHLCNSNFFFGTRQREDVDRLSGHWKEKASVPTVTILKQKITEGEQKILHICLLPRIETRPWKENKFKLLGVRVY
ncbi:hypothetical protein HJC23_002603 [Cyclotella cryptica]|uniref:SGNH hydrolase-type esterase domain-containing protein n=1 Tax=Cyclotella cryptica TaxID=29204 RepID=A0ABD3PZG7_9STRA|eukprot:CCRYP_010354-RA/>CCRYP_010354-RA protein AED:0.04 eAED:0.04 QI:162/1/0.8/1/0.75/0.6/5/1713/658